MTSFKGYANDVEDERFNVESMRSFLKIVLNRFLAYKNKMFNAWKPSPFYQNQGYFKLRSGNFTNVTQLYLFMGFWKMHLL